MIDNFEKFVFYRIEDILSETFLIDSKECFWVLDLNLGTWFLCYQNSGNLTYNFSKFSSCLHLFNLKTSEFSKILKKWLEKTLKIQVRSVQRVNTNQDYLLDDIKTTRKRWKLNQRYGFSYDFVKKVQTKVEIQSKCKSEGSKEEVPMKSLFLNE